MTHVTSYAHVDESHQAAAAVENCFKNSRKKFQLLEVGGGYAPVISGGSRNVSSPAGMVECEALVFSFYS